MSSIPRESDERESEALSEKTLHQIIEQQDEGWNELPDDAAFSTMETPARPKKLATLKKNIKRRISRIFRRKRSYAYRLV